GVFRAILDTRDPATAAPESELEIRLRRLLRRHALPEPIPQYRLDLPGRPPVFLDFAYPDRKLAIEADSRRWHAGVHDVQRNSEKRNIIALLGWTLLTFT